MDDVDAVQAQISRNMLQSGDWVTARLNGVAYLEKAPLIYWMMAGSYAVFGVHDWSARLPLALAVILLCWVVYRFGRWGLNEDAGLFAGLALSTCIGLFLFTRILIPDATLTLVITGAIWAWLQLLEPEPERPMFWAAVMGVCLGAGLLLKSLIGVVFPIAAGLAYMAATHQLWTAASWKKLKLPVWIPLALLVAVPWHAIATLRNPPYFDFTLHSGPGEYRGFFWFFFFNEQLLRFLNLRYPRDYNTVPRVWFWLFNLIWLFPWSVYLPASFRMDHAAGSRQQRVKIMLYCWIFVVMGFFTFSTTQEYYSMPIYPALALLAGVGLSTHGKGVKRASRLLFALFSVLGMGLLTVLCRVWRIPATGSIADALTQHPDLYTLSLGHIGDLTMNAFAYLKLPLGLACVAFFIAAIGLLLFRNRPRAAILATALGMIVFFHAARVALIRFDSYLGSYPLVQALEKSPPGQLIEGNAYYAFSSVFFYTNRTALLLNGRMNNLEYGSYAPGAPEVFIDDAKFLTLWKGPQRCYLLIYGSEMPHIEEVAGRSNLHVVAENAGNFLLSNQ
jgi:hypothetical protein